MAPPRKPDALPESVRRRGRNRKANMTPAAYEAQLARSCSWKKANRAAQTAYRRRYRAATKKEGGACA